MFLTLIAFFVRSELLSPESSAAAFGAPNAAQRDIKFLLLGLSVAIILSRLRVMQSLLKCLNPPFIAFLVLAPLSILWSIEPSATIARYISLITLVLVCFAVGAVSSERQRLQEILRPILTMFLLASLLVGIIWPDIVIEKGDDISLKDAWHGLAAQKNEFGQIASFAAIVWFHTWLTREVNRGVAIVGLAIAAACLLLSRSSTSLFATAFAIGTLLLLQRAPASMRRYIPYVVGVLIAFLLTYAVAVLNLVPGLGTLLTPFTALTGKDMSLSGRVLIWNIVKEHIALAPILGSGYGAYWVGPIPSSPSYIFLARMYLYPTESHNGYLEIVNDLGFVGLACVLAYIITYVKQTLKLMTFDRTQAALYLAFMVQQVIINLSEACWLAARSVSANILILATVLLGRALAEQRRALAAKNIR